MDKAEGKQLLVKNESKPNHYGRQTERYRRLLERRDAWANWLEMVVCTFNIHTLAYKGANGVGHNTTIILHIYADTGCHVIGLQETRREGEGAISARGYFVVWSGTRARTHEGKGVHGVGLAIKQSIVDEMEEGGMAAECIGARLMKVRLQPTGRNGVSCVVAYAPTECGRVAAVRNMFWETVDTAIRQVQPRR